jgi:hypothetical protein
MFNLNLGVWFRTGRRVPFTLLSLLGRSGDISVIMPMLFFFRQNSFQFVILHVPPKTLYGSGVDDIVECSLSSWNLAHRSGHAV